jgi:hypothetical protein
MPRWPASNSSSQKNVVTTPRRETDGAFAVLSEPTGVATGNKRGDPALVKARAAVLRNAGERLTIEDIDIDDLGPHAVRGAVAAELLNEKTLRGSNMGSNPFRLDDINKAFDDMLSGSIARSVIIFDG